ncbi:MAG: HEAT repeat domain-containing protein [Myxococcota bacterium]
MASDARAARLARDSRTTDELVAIALAEVGSDAASDAIATLQCRGSQEEFDLAAQLSRSRDEHHRRVAADVLGQLGWSDRSFLAPSVDLLIGMLGDESSDVVSSAAVALGHRHDPRAIPHLATLQAHADPSVRLGVAHGLLGYDDDAAVTALVALSQDADDSVRSWATFGIGTQTEADSAEVREALLRRTEDPQPEIRGEALIGLARRGDLSAMPALRRELDGAFEGSWPLEAAALFGDADLRPLLESAWERAGERARRQFESEFQDALAACGARPSRT